MKKIVSAFFALALVIVCLWVFSVSANAAAGGTCGDNLTWTLDGAGTLTISGTGAMRNYVWGDAPWNSSRDSINTILIEDGVTTIGDFAFYECTNLTSITIPDSVTGIGNWAFLRDAKLTGLKLPGKLTYLGQQAFEGCSSITEIEIPGTVTYIDGGVFGGCTALARATFHSGPIPSFICADSMFSRCTALEEIRVDEGHLALYDMDGVLYCGKTLMQYPSGRRNPAFVIPDGIHDIFNFAITYAQYLESVTISESVTAIGNYAFQGCGSLKWVTLGNNIATIGDGAFDGCRSLESVTIPNSVTTIGHAAFSNCTGLASVTIPSGITAISGYMFSGCTGLTSVTIPDSVTTIGEWAFNGCDSLSGIWVDGNNPVYSSDDRGALLNKDKTVLIKVPGGIDGVYAVPDSVTTIGDYAFAKCSGLNGVTIPDGVTTIGNYAFWDCTGLTSVMLPDGVKTIGGHAFYYCANLTSVNIPNSVTTIGDAAFSSCFDLTSVTLPESVTTIGNEVFYYCSALTGIWVDGSNPAYCSDDRGVLYNKDKTVLVAAPGRISDAYTIPDGVTTISSYAFNNCSFLYWVTLPDSVKTIGEYAFYYCTSLMSVAIPDSVTTIGASAFCYCLSLETVTVGSGVNTIGDYAFSGCYALTDVYYTGTQARWAEVSIGMENEYLTGATFCFEHIHAPCSDSVVTVEATCTANGYVEYTCVCGGTIHKTLPRLPHSFADGVCTVCGAPESLPGDLDGNEVVDEDDVICLLRYLLMPGDFPVDQFVDYDNSGAVDEDDVIYLLQHLLMPDDFPLKQ